MRQKWQKATACMLAAATLFSVSGCGDPALQSTGSTTEEKPDVERTQLYIYNVDFAGSDGWLHTLAEKFEREHAADANWESGKTGVQVIVRTTANRDEDLTSRLSAGQDDVYFAQAPSYRALVKKGLLADVTQAVEESLTGESRSIEDKLTDGQKAYYGVESTDGEPTYYAVPYRRSYFGITYNVDLFEKECYYFAAESADGVFVKSATDARSAGPDGKVGTADDGLPSTYAEFFTLCDRIVANGQTPMTWGGERFGEYLTWLANALAADGEGYAQTMLRFSPDGETNNLGLIKNGDFAQDETPTQLTEANGYELARSSGVYDALHFVKKLTAEDTYYDGEAFRTDRTQKEAQADFLAETPAFGKKQIAMLADGNWWQSGWLPKDEAIDPPTENGDSLSTVAAQATLPADETPITERRLGWMPFPKSTAEKVGEPTALYDCLSSAVFLSAKTKQEKLAKEFLRFLCSNENLKEYVTAANASVALDVTLGDDGWESLSYFGRSALEMQMSADMVCPYSTHPLFLNNESYFTVKQSWRAAFDLMTPTQYPVEAFRKNNVSVVDYFSGMYKYRKESWQTLQKPQAE